MGPNSLSFTSRSTEWESCDPEKVTLTPQGVCSQLAVSDMRAWSGQGGAGSARREAWYVESMDTGCNGDAHLYPEGSCGSLVPRLWGLNL